jgi:hypothetical protein
VSFTVMALIAYASGLSMSMRRTIWARLRKAARLT